MSGIGPTWILEQWPRLRGGQAPAEFESTSAPDTTVAFANATRDCPRRIRYRRVVCA